MAEDTSYDRRRFLGTAALTMAAARFGLIGAADAQSSKIHPADATPMKPGTHTSFGARQQRAPAAVQLPIEGELPSLGSATAWLNSPPLTAAGLRGKSSSSTSGPIPASIGSATSLCPRVGREIQGSRIGRDRRALAGVRL